MTSSTSLPFIKSSILLFSQQLFSAIFVRMLLPTLCEFSFLIGMTCPFLNRPEELQQLVFCSPFAQQPDQGGVQPYWVWHTVTWCMEGPGHVGASG